MSEYSFLSNVKLLIYDCDGVMTDNKVIVDENGKEHSTFNRGDGLGIKYIQEMNIKQIVISTESNPIVKKRCEKLDLFAIYSIMDKKEALKKYCTSEKIDPKSAMFIGNDINDLSAMRYVGYCGCPADAEPEIMSICDWISSKKGGEGVIRELYRYICYARR